MLYCNIGYLVIKYNIKFTSYITHKYKYMSRYNLDYYTRINTINDYVDITFEQIKDYHMNLINRY